MSSVKKWKKKKVNPQLIRDVIEGENHFLMGAAQPSSFERVAESSRRATPPRIGPGWKVFDEDDPYGNVQQSTPHESRFKKWDLWIGIGIFIAVVVAINWGAREIIEWRMQ